MKKVLRGYVYGDMVNRGWQDKTVSGRYPETHDSAIIVYRKKMPGLVACKITLLK